MKAYIFDLDGTVANTIDDITRAVNSMLVSYSLPIFTTDEIKLKIGNGAKNLVKRSLPEEKAEDEAFVVEALKNYQAKYDEYCLDKVRLYDGLYDVLVNLKKQGKHLAIVTNKDASHAAAIVDKLIPNTFDKVIGYDGTFPHKPAPDAVLSLMKEFCVTPSETAFIGDLWVDVETARRAHTLCVGVSWGFLGTDVYKGEHVPDVIIERAEDLYLI